MLSRIYPILIALIALTFSTDVLGQCDCDPTNNLITNGDFSNVTTTGNPCSSTISHFYQGCVAGWNSTHGTPSIGGGANKYVFMWSIFNNGEGIKTNANIQAGHTYNFKFRVATEENVNGGNILVRLTNGLGTGGSVSSPQGQPYPSAPAGTITLWSETSNNLPLSSGTWQEVCITFTPTSSFSQIWIMPTQNSLGGDQCSIVMDDFCLEEDDCSNTQPSFTWEFDCQNDDVVINATANQGCSGSEFRLYNTNGNCQAGNISTSCMIFPPISTQTGNSFSFTVPHVVGTEYVLEHFCGGCPYRELITIVEWPAPDISGITGTVCEDQANIIIPAGMLGYYLEITEAFGGVICSYNSPLYPAAGVVNLFDICPGLTCGQGTCYKIDITYYDLCVNDYNLSATAHFLCSPNVQAVANPGVVCPGDYVTYCVVNPSSSLSYQWFDDNGPLNTGTCTSPIPYDPADGAIYVVATDANGCQGSAKPLLGISSDCDPVGICAANFSWTAQSSIFGGCLVNFTDLSVAGGNIVSWVWDFGDQTGWNVQNPSHLYASANQSYYACLTITTDDNCTHTYCDWVGCRREKKERREAGELTTAFKFYPNPANTRLNLDYDLEEVGEATFSLFDITGRVVKTETLSGSETFKSFELGDLTAGIYMARIVSGSESIFNQKIVIEK